MHRYKNLKVWNESRELVKLVYQSLNQFPKEELFGLTSQIKRSVISISSNIAEGCGRRTDKDLANFLDIASGSVREIESQLFMANEIGYLSNEELENLEKGLLELGRLISGFRNYILKE